MADTVELSQRAYDRLKAEYDDLTTRGRIDIARKIETARELGDLSENGDYHAAKEEQGKMEGRIMHLGRTLENTHIVQADGSDEVNPGSVVTIRFSGDDATEQYLLGSIEERHETYEIMSTSSPLGEALRGHVAGDVISYQTPSGAAVQVELVAVD